MDGTQKINLCKTLSSTVILSIKTQGYAVLPPIQMLSAFIYSLICLDFYIIFETFCFWNF